MQDIHTGDCGEILKAYYKDETFDLIVTSPPYADQRKKTYGGIHPDKYVEWFMPLAKEMHRVLKLRGSFILNIKEKVVDGQRHTYVIDLIKAMKADGWFWTEEYIWRKKNCSPGKWPNRFRDAWERCLHFTKQKGFEMYQDAVRVPMGDWAKSRLKKLSDTDKVRDESKTKSGFGKNISNWLGRDTVLPSNVLENLPEDGINDFVDGLTAQQLECLTGHIMEENVLALPTECGNKEHSAAFPVALPEWFIKLFTNPDDIVLDPFAGSGTTAVAARKLGRGYCMIELLEENRAVMNKRLGLFTAETTTPTSNKENTDGNEDQQGPGDQGDYRGPVEVSEAAHGTPHQDRVEGNRPAFEPGAHPEVADPGAYST